jgi:hypothetical protein
MSSWVTAKFVSGTSEVDRALRQGVQSKELCARLVNAYRCSHSMSSDRAAPNSRGGISCLLFLATNNDGDLRTSQSRESLGLRLKIKHFLLFQDLNADSSLVSYLPGASLTFCQYNTKAGKELVSGLRGPLCTDA